MSDTVGLRELRQHSRAVMDRVRNGERLIVTDHNKPIAAIVPYDEVDMTYVEPGSAVEALIKEGLAVPPRGPLVIDPIRLEPGEMTLSEALEEVSEEREI